MGHSSVYGHGQQQYSHSSHSVNQMSPTDDHSAAPFNSMPYSSSQREMMVPSSQYSYHDNQTWGFQSNASHSGGSLSSLLNPSSSSAYSSSRQPINTYPSFSTQSHPSPASDSRPNTGYSVSSMSSMPYEDKGSSHYSHDYNRPNSSHHGRAPSPTSSRPGSSHQAYAQDSLSVRRARRHSQAMSPYPSPYGHGSEQRPSTSPHPLHGDGGEHSLPRVRSMASTTSGDSYSFNPAQGDFAYSAAPMNGSVDSLGGGWDSSRSVRPSTSASSLSAASHTSSSQARTPPAGEHYAGETDINRC
jgi:hypothetical protein